MEELNKQELDDYLTHDYREDNSDPVGCKECEVNIRADERTKTLKEVGEWLDTESFDVKDRLSTWLLVGLSKLKRGEKPGAKA